MCEPSIRDLLCTPRLDLIYRKEDLVSAWGLKWLEGTMSCMKSGLKVVSFLEVDVPWKPY
jgi:hypothetical protein